MVKVFIMAGLPPKLVKAFLQHVRDFDAAHPGADCKFEIMMDAPAMSLGEAIRAMQIDPPLDVMDVLTPKKPTCQ